MSLASADRRRLSIVFVAISVTSLLAMALVATSTVRANPDHTAGDYFMFAKALAPDTDDNKANEPECDATNDKQADISGSSSHFYGRIHSNADLANSGDGHTFHDTASPNEEITYGVHEPPACVLQADTDNDYWDGDLDPQSPPGPPLGPLNITGSGVATDIHGPYQIGECGWPGNLGTFLDDDCDTFGDDITQILGEGAECDHGSLTGTTTITVQDTAEFNDSIVCNGTGEILLGDQDFGTAGEPFRITMISHGQIKVSGSDQFLAPSTKGHGIMAWTDMPFGTDATAVEIAGSNVNVTRRAILFTPMSGQSVSGSLQATLCIQMIGQGSLLANGSSTTFGPLAPGCGGPASVVTDIHADLSGVGGDAHHSLGHMLSAVEVGTPIHDEVIVSSSVNAALTGTITVERFDNGTCEGDAAATAAYTAGVDAETPTGGTYLSATMVSIDPVLPFTPAVGVYSYQASYGGDELNDEAIGACEGPVHVVDATVAISPASAFNEVDTLHDLTTTVTVQGGAIATGGATVTAIKQSGPGSFVDDAPAGQCTTPGGAAEGDCDVTLSSSTAGTTVVSSSASIPIDVDADGDADITITRGTGTTAQTGAASKTWVAVRISISPLNAANEIESSHTLTILLEQSVQNDVWTPLAGEVVTASITDADGASAFFLVGPTCTTAADGTCDVVISSGTVGTTTVNASWGGGTVGGAAVSAKNSDPDAVKLWVAVRISITPLDDANEVGTPHELEILLEQSTAEDTWTPLAGQCVLVGLVNDDGAGATFVDTDPAADCDGEAPEGDSCLTGTDGTCTVTITSPTTGTTTVEAGWSGTAQGATIGAKLTDPDALKTWVAVRIGIEPLEATNPVGTEHELDITLEQSVADTVWTPLAGECVTATLSDADGATTTFVDTDAAADCNGDAIEGNACITGADGICTVTITSPTAGTTTIEASWPGGTVAGAVIGSKVTEPDALKHWVAGAAVLLIIDEDSLDNGIHYHPTGGGIVPSGPSFFSTLDVNDDMPGHRQRSVLRFFAENVDATITVKTGQTGDEGWFAPNCIPQHWISGTSKACLPAGDLRDLAIDNFFGLNGTGAIPAQSRLDKIPAVMPLRARGLVALEGQTVCAVVYDSDLSINYNKSAFPFTDGNLQGETLGIVAFRVDDVRRLNGFSSSTLPEVQLTILGTDACGAWSLLNAPVPRSSSVPNDIDPANLAGTGSRGYRQLFTFPGEPPFH